MTTPEELLRKVAWHCVYCGAWATRRIWLEFKGYYGICEQHYAEYGANIEAANGQYPTIADEVGQHLTQEDLARGVEDDN
jgi:hypothetical protein